ncbi:hypothetical protein [Chitinophaga silvisoli]|uniref:Uncharacterized protein n=1 Tax=Chitinophaga silvisoli TaxID=2291814 RepID=A0A3E1P2N5_9BACT|nr:hypothetical protein [Chitinophaga silvisoli]RFM34425.1 hypothetical protein DXN04_14180 [Chitinophaga silvisoli]
MWWKGRINSNGAATIVWRILAAWTDQGLRRIATFLNGQLGKLTVKQNKAFWGLFVVFFGAAGVICAIPGINILPAYDMPPVLFSPPPVFPSETRGNAYYSTIDSLRAYNFSVLLDSLRKTEEGRREIEAFENQHPGLIDSMLQVSNSLYPKK